MQIHLITGHREVTSSRKPVALYCGDCADEAVAARDAALASGEFAAVEQHIVDRGVLRYPAPEAVAAWRDRQGLPLQPQEQEESPSPPARRKK